MHVDDTVHANFHSRVSATLIFCNKNTRVAYVSLASQPIFPCNQDAHTMDIREALHPTSRLRVL